MKKYIFNYFGVALCILGLSVSCTKKEETVTPVVTVTPPPTETIKIDLNLRFTKVSFDSTVSRDADKTFFLKAYVYNLETTKNDLSDSVFVWERLTYSKPANWILSFCDPEICNNVNTIKREFVLREGKKGLIDFNIGALDPVTETSMPLGVGEMNTTYVIYRKGMDKKDGQVLTVKFTAI